jgi:hypothetical protein
MEEHVTGILLPPVIFAPISGCSKSPSDYDLNSLLFSCHPIGAIEKTASSQWLSE